jgi:hypothetical protein
MGTPPNEEIIALESELEQVTGQIGSPLSPEAKGSPGQQSLMRRKQEIEGRLAELRRENDQALGEDLVDPELIEPGS